jgi:hypothetical protein
MKGVPSSRHLGGQPNRVVVLSGALFVVLISLLFYLKTLAPTVLYCDPTAFPDSVVLQIQAIVLGIPHTTGYPTWVMLTHLFTYLPVGDPAYRANLSSAVYAAAAVLLVYLLCLRLTRRAVPSCVGALLFGLSRDFWSQAVITEVYTLNALFVALIIFLLLLWRDTRDDRYLLLACFSMGRRRRGLWPGYLGGAQRSMGKEIAAVPDGGCGLRPVSGGGYRALERSLLRGSGLPADSRRVRGLLRGGKGTLALL